MRSGASAGCVSASVTSPGTHGPTWRLQLREPSALGPLVAGLDVERRWTALEPHQTGVYVNFLMDEGNARIRRAYGRGKYERLKALKREYDPENLFHVNQNIRPNGSG